MVDGRDGRKGAVLVLSSGSITTVDASFQECSGARARKEGSEGNDGIEGGWRRKKSERMEGWGGGSEGGDVNVFFSTRARGSLATPPSCTVHAA